MRSVRHRSEFLVALSTFVIGKEHYVRLCTYPTPSPHAGRAAVMAVGGMALVARSSRRGRGVLVLALVVGLVLAGVAVFRLPGFPRNCGL
jgi:predicted exporter